MGKRIKTKYPGVFFRESTRIGGRGVEKIFYIVFKKSGKVIEEKVGRQYADAMTEARASKIRAERIEGKRPSPKEVRESRKAKKKIWTFDLLWEEYKLQKINFKGKGPDENRYQKWIKPSFGNKEPKDLVPLDVDRIRIKMLKKKSPQTVKLTLALLRRIANFGNKKTLCEPLSFKIEMPEVHNEKTEDLTPEQLKNLINAIEKDENEQVKNLMKMVLFTGMRRGELFKLKWEDVDEHRGFINIKDPKGGPDQKIPLNDAAREVLKKHVRTRSPFVFPGRNGHKRVDINHQVNRIKKAAGLPKDFRPLHGLRHAYASMLASSGEVDLYTLQKLLTHKDPRMTQRYAHLRDETLKKASSLATKIIDQAVTSKDKIVELDKDKK